MADEDAEQNAVPRKSVTWITRYGQILTVLLVQAIFVVACISLFLMLSGMGQLEDMNATETMVMLAGGFLPLVVSVISMFMMVKVKFRKAIEVYQVSGDSPSLPILTDQPLSEPLEKLLFAFTAATHKCQAFFFTSATINLVLVYFDESWLHLVLAFLSVFAIVWLTPTIGRLARFIQNALDRK
jgi:hypothetical protein